MTRLSSKKIVKTNSCKSCLRAPVCLLGQTPLSNAQLDAFHFSARTLNPSEHLCHQGQLSQHLYIIRAGILKSYVTKTDGEEYVMGFHLPPDLFGWEGIDAAQRAISVVALEPSNICIIPTEKMGLLTQQLPQLSNQLLQMVSRRIQQDNIALLRTSAQQRVATFLLQLTARYQQLGFSGNTCQLAMTHQDIANYLRITPETISRIFHDFQKKKLITLSKHSVTLQDTAHIMMLSNQT